MYRILFSIVLMNSTNVQQHKDLDAGVRTVGSMNYSYFVTLPNLWVQNYLENNKDVKIAIAPDGTLTITPVGDK